MNLPQIVMQTLTNRSTAVIKDGDVVVVGVSGGADSLALLHVLNRLRERLGIGLRVATLDHGIRGKAGADDAEFVRQLAESWGLPVSVGYEDVPKRADEWRMGIEAAARRARYNFLAAAAREAGAQTIAVAHHGDDQAETVLMRILRGTGLRGLGGMAFAAPVPEHPDLTLIRPLLKVSRADIEAYCREHDLQPREDATNSDTTYVRNRLRHEIIPMLESVYPNTRGAINQLADIAAVDDDFLEAYLLREFIQPYVQNKQWYIVIDRQAFQQLHPALQRRCIAWACRQVNNDSWFDNAAEFEPNYDHIIAAVKVGQSGDVGAVAEFPLGIRLRVLYDKLIFEESTSPPREYEWDLAYLAIDRKRSISVTIPGVTLTGNHQLKLQATFTRESEARARLAITEGANVILRTRQAGDRFAPLGMNGHTRKLKEWFVNRKVPQIVRGNIPLLVVDGEIAAILIGDAWPISEKFKVRDDSPRVVYFSLL